VFLISADSIDHVSRMSVAVDDMFRNSPAPTRTEAEQVFDMEAVAMFGNVKGFILSISLAVLFATLMASATTVAMSIRERTREGHGTAHRELCPENNRGVICWRSGYAVPDGLVARWRRSLRTGKNSAATQGFRHFNATEMDSKNVPVKTRQTRLGHDDPRMNEFARVPLQHHDRGGRRCDEDRGARDHQRRFAWRIVSLHTRLFANGASPAVESQGKLGRGSEQKITYV
jgi:hypothetical protein